MSVQTVIEPQFRDLHGRFTKASKTLDEETQKSVQMLGRSWVQLAQAEAPRKTGTFATSIRYYPFTEPDTFGFKGLSAQPLGNYIKFGTAPHSIAARNTGALHFFWERVGLETFVPRRGGFKTHQIGNQLFIGKGFVAHPGTKPNEYHLRAFEQFWPQLQAQIRRVSENFVITLAGP